MKYLLLTSLLILVGCQTVPVPQQTWPAPPTETSMETCQELKKLESPVTLSSLSKIIAENYTQYHLCSSKAVSWQEWYNLQKQVYEQQAGSNLQE